MRRWLISSATSRRRHHSRVGTSGAAKDATVVPHEPAPTTVNRCTEQTVPPALVAIETCEPQTSGAEV